jgi:hypothetical protein
MMKTIAPPLSPSHTVALALPTTQARSKTRRLTFTLVAGLAVTALTLASSADAASLVSNPTFQWSQNGNTNRTQTCKKSVSMSRSKSVGNRNRVQMSVAGGAWGSVNSRDATAKGWGRLNGCALGKCAALLDAYAYADDDSGTSIKARLAGRTIYHRRYRADGRYRMKNFPDRMIVQKNLAKEGYVLIPRWVEATVSADVGIGVRGAVGLAARNSPKPTVNVRGSVMGFANGTGTASIRLGSLGSAKLQQIVEAPGPKLAVTFETGCGAKVRADQTFQSYALRWKVSGKAGCVKAGWFGERCAWRGSKTLFNYNGPSKTYRLF